MQIIFFFRYLSSPVPLVKYLLLYYIKITNQQEFSNICTGIVTFILATCNMNKNYRVQMGNI